MNLQHLRYLAAFAESRTLTGAAESLGISQPAISRALRELQDELQCVLFRRTGRRLEFTKEGKAVLEATRRALAAIEDIRRVVPEQDGKARSERGSLTCVNEFAASPLSGRFR